MDIDQLEEAVEGLAITELSRVSGFLDASFARQKTREYFESYEQSLENGAWKNNVPGKQVLSTFASKTRLDEDRLKTMYIRKAMERDDEANPFTEIVNILGGFSR